MKTNQTCAQLQAINSRNPKRKKRTLKLLSLELLHQLYLEAFILAIWRKTTNAGSFKSLYESVLLLKFIRSSLEDFS